MATNFCPNCGAKIRAGAKFCGSCGQEISDASSPKIELQKSASPTSTQPTYTPPVNQASTQPTYTSPQISAEGIVLKSSAPISDKRPPWASTAYLVCGLVSVVGLGLFALPGTETTKTLGLIGLVVGVVGLLLIANHDNNSIQDQLDELRVTKFKFVHNVTADEVYGRLQPALNAVWGGQVDFDRRDEIISITHDKTIYDIGLNDDGTFIVHWHKSLGGIFSSTDSWGKICKKIRTDTAVIAYELQRQFNVTD